MILNINGQIPVRVAQYPTRDPSDRYRTQNDRWLDRLKSLLSLLFTCCFRIWRNLRSRQTRWRNWWWERWARNVAVECDRYFPHRLPSFFLFFVVAWEKSKRLIARPAVCSRPCLCTNSLRSLNFIRAPQAWNMSRSWHTLGACGVLIKFSAK